MPKLVKNQTVIDNDPWILIAAEEDSCPKIHAFNIVPLSLWQQEKDHFSNTEIAVWLDSHETLDSIIDDLDRLPLIALNFPLFTDGRAYSLASRLREHHHYSGEIRAVGDVLLDQLYYMQRCGFSSYSLREDAHYAHALHYFETFKQVYQTSTKTQESILEKRLHAQ